MSSGHATFRAHLLAGVIATVTAAVFSFLVHGTKAMHLYEELNFDAWTIGNAESRSDLFLVVIDDESYAKDFEYRSPLRQETVQRLIASVAERGATVIGVDLDTRDWDPGLLDTVPESTRRRVVWARLPLGVARERTPGARERYARLLALQHCAGSVMFGASDVHHPEDSSITGITRTMPRSEQIDGQALPPLGNLVARVAREGPSGCETAHPVEPRSEYMRFLQRDGEGRPHVPIVSAHSLLTSAAGRFDGAIVLIGSMLTDGGDVVRSPFGLQSGVALHADVVHTRLSGAPYRAWTSQGYLLLDLVAGLAIVGFGWITRHHAGVFWLGLLLIGVGAPFVSLGTFQFGGQFLSIWPMLLGVGLHEAAERLAPQYWRRIWRDLPQPAAALDADPRRRIKDGRLGSGGELTLER